MNDNEKSKEELVAEIAVLRQDLEEMRNRDKQNLVSDATAESERYKTLVSEVPEYLYSIEFNKGNIATTFHSPRCEEITGYSPREYAANPYLWLEMIHEKDRDRVRDFIQGLKEPLNCKSIEHRIIHKNGSVRWVVNMTTVHMDSKSSILRQSGFLIDVTGRREEEERNLLIFNENRHNSLFDGLTGLYNRRGFWELAEQQLRVAARINQPVLLFFIDVDKLKQTNDAFGHHAGDNLLISLAAILKHTFRESDLIARIGGDEFTILTMETGPDSNELFFERLRANLENKNHAAIDMNGMSVSVGVSRYSPHDSDTVTSLIDRADKDMYARKRSKYAQVN
jgi:diguanylate cyclase (GGDEF)-like protein/PAS domain S-box-containing protein